MIENLGKHGRLLCKENKSLEDWEAIIEHFVASFWRIFDASYMPEIEM